MCKEEKERGSIAERTTLALAVPKCTLTPRKRRRTAERIYRQANRKKYGWLSQFKIDASWTQHEYTPTLPKLASPRLVERMLCWSTAKQRGTNMDIVWPLLGINVIIAGLGWSMRRGTRQQRQRLIARRASAVASRQKEQPPHAVASHPAELHCPHCGHIIGDRDFARQHAPTVDWPGRASRDFRQPPV